MSRASNLYALQQIDNQLDRHRKRLLEIVALLADNAAIKRAEAKLKTAQNALEKAWKELRGAEGKVKEQRLKIEQNEATLYGGKIRNPKELQDLQDEVAALKRYLSVLEDRQLEAMLHVDDMEEEHTATQDVLSHAREEADKLHRDLSTEKTEIEKDVQTLEAKRLACLSTITVDDIAVYERLRKGRAGMAVSKVNDRACSACGATLTAALFQAARSPNQITHCDTCGRILYAT